MLPLYFLIIFLSSFILADIGVMSIINIGMSMYFVDLLFLYFLFCFIYVAVTSKFHFQDTSKWFICLIATLLFSIFYGATKYGFSAFGEGRYIYWIFFFVVPLYFYKEKILHSLKSLDKFVKITYLLITITVLLLLTLELINGGRIFFTNVNQQFANLEDGRGVRYLGSEETFNLGVVVMFLIIHQFVNKKRDLLQLLLIVLLTAVIFFTKNRTALISLFLSLTFVLITEGKAKLVLRLAFLLCVLLGISHLLFPAFTASVVSPLTSVLNISEDETGNWRLLIQAVAIEQSMQTPVLGQGFGGYYSYYVESMGLTIEYPPHSIYILLFQKGGALALCAYVFAIFSLIRQSSMLKRYTAHNCVAEQYRLLFKVIFVAQIPYGFAYNFSLYFGLYVGLFVVLRNIVNERISKQTLVYAAA